MLSTGAPLVEHCTARTQLMCASVAGLAMLFFVCSALTQPRLDLSIHYYYVLVSSMELMRYFILTSTQKIPRCFFVSGASIGNTPQLSAHVSIIALAVEDLSAALGVAASL